VKVLFEKVASDIPKRDALKAILKDLQTARASGAPLQLPAEFLDRVKPVVGQQLLNDSLRFVKENFKRKQIAAAQAAGVGIAASTFGSLSIASQIKKVDFKAAPPVKTESPIKTPSPYPEHIVKGVSSAPREFKADEVATMPTKDTNAARVDIL